MNSLPAAHLDNLTRALIKGAALELYLTPKPGLVDLLDNGSHRDLDLAKMEASIHVIGGYLTMLVRSLTAGEDFAARVDIGLLAERVMYDHCGANTHRGYIFLSGLLLSACHQAPADDEERLRAAVRQLAAEYFTCRGEPDSNGRRARDCYRVGGIVREAREGLPSLFDEALPAYRSTVAAGGDFQDASFAMLARLMQVVDDTTALHRCGTIGLTRLRGDGARLELLIRAGDDYRQYLTRLNRDYMAMNLTMGGIADLLALAFGYLSATEAIGAGLAPVA